MHCLFCVLCPICCLQLGGIPLSVYQAAKARLAYTKQLTLRVPLVATCRRDSPDSTEAGDSLLNLADEVSEAVHAASQALHSGCGGSSSASQAEAEAATSMASRVRLDRLTSQRLHQVEKGRGHVIGVVFNWIHSYSSTTNSC